MSECVVGTHNAIHSDQGALSGEHPGRSTNPVIKVHGIAWLEFERPDRVRAEAFARTFGFSAALRTSDELHLRGSDAGTPCVIVRKGERSRFVGVAVDLMDPSGLPVRVVAGNSQLEPLLAQTPHVFNFGHDVSRVNSTQRPPRVPTRVQRLGHVVLQTTKYRQALDWYLDHFGLIVSDFQYYPGQRDRGPVMSFIRCVRGQTPADHHTLALALGPSNRYLHSAYQVSDIDALATGGQYLKDLGYKRSWGIGRHMQGSQIFDYWLDPDGFLVEHFSDGDMFDNSLEPGRAPFTASGLNQWTGLLTSAAVSRFTSLTRVRQRSGGDAGARLPAGLVGVARTFDSGRRHRGTYGPRRCAGIRREFGDQRSTAGAQ